MPSRVNLLSLFSCFIFLVTFLAILCY
uniref:Uncharacterized protein n=1 Tax=Rhizophora mucronata TaxID=61149 RepID=A0A2P2QYD5_RHIMU